MVRPGCSSTLTAFLMEWDDIQLNRRDRRRQSVVAARHVQRRQGRAEGRRDQRQLDVRPRISSFNASVFLADPEFSEDTFVSGRDDLEFADGHGHAEFAGARSTGSRSSTRSRTSWSQGDLWARIAYSYQVEVWNDLDGDLGLLSCRDPGDRGSSRAAHPVLYVDHACSSGTRTTTAGRRRSMVRNLFDERGYRLPELDRLQLRPGRFDDLPCDHDR